MAPPLSPELPHDGLRPEALALIAADGAAVVTYTERFWQVLAVGPAGAAPDDARVAPGIELLFRRDLLRQQSSIDDLAEVASSDDHGWRATSDPD